MSWASISSVKIQNCMRNPSAIIVIACKQPQLVFFSFIVSCKNSSQTTETSK